MLAGTGSTAFEWAHANWNNAQLDLPGPTVMRRRGRGTRCGSLTPMVHEASTARFARRRWSLQCRSLQGNQSDVIFLLPLFSGESLQLGQQRIDQPRTAGVCTNK